MIEVPSFEGFGFGGSIDKTSSNCEKVFATSDCTIID